MGKFTNVDTNRFSGILRRLMVRSKKQIEILMTGGSGTLGTEILKLDPQIRAPSHKELDITNYNSILRAIKKYKPDVVLHLAAINPPKFTKNPKLGLTINIIGTANVALACLVSNIKLVYVSTDFVYVGKGPHKETEPIFPPNPFSWSKVGGECATQVLPNSLILRPSLGPNPFPWPKVFRGQYNSRLYFDEAAPLILAIARSNATGILNLGGPCSTMEAHARRTNKKIKTTAKPIWFPQDTSFDLTKMKRELGIKDLHSVIKH